MGTLIVHGVSPTKQNFLADLSVFGHMDFLGYQLL